MSAVLTKKNGRRVLVVHYSTAGGDHDFDRMIERARLECGIGDEALPVVLIPETIREVFRGKHD